MCHGSSMVKPRCLHGDKSLLSYQVSGCMYGVQHERGNTQKMNEANTTAKLLAILKTLDTLNFEERSFSYGFEVREEDDHIAYEFGMHVTCVLQVTQSGVVIYDTDATFENLSADPQHYTSMEAWAWEMAKYASELCDQYTDR